MKDFWNARYAESGLAYGQGPNEFFKNTLTQAEPGRLLLPGEGEGRNAIYAAMQGWQVTAFDFSEHARQKALNWAEKEGVNIDYQHADYLEFTAPPRSFNMIALIYAHMDEDIRRTVHRKPQTLLKPGGIIIMEAFSKAQLGRDSGGPKKESMLYSREDFKEEFDQCYIFDLKEEEVTLAEGPFHQGKAMVLRMIAGKQ